MTRTRIARTSVAVALIATLVAPAAAYAVPGRGKPAFGAPKPTADAKKQEIAVHKREVLAERITRILQRRQGVFDAIADRLLKRIDRVEALSATVEEKGGDVTAVRSKLEAARAQVAQAKALEAQAIELFRSVPDATDKKAAFGAARAKAKEAVKRLHQARATLRGAMLDLRAIANGLKGAETGESD